MAIFERRILPVPDETERLSTTDVAAECGMTAKRVENVGARANARFREHVHRTVRQESAVEAEMADLQRLLAG